MEIQDSSNRQLKVIECDRWTGKDGDPFYVAHTAGEVFRLNRNNILSMVKKKGNEDYTQNY
jgi:hypothetical protein